MSGKHGKLYMLRHEKRGPTTSFSTPLTPEGLANAATKVVETLKPKHFCEIYCSPFVRTLQTIQPYCLGEHRKVNVEWSLVESIPQESTYPAEFKDIVNSDYESFLNIRDADIIIDDVFEGLKEQVGPFIDSLDKDKNILLVTHMPVINAILSYRGNPDVTMFTHHHPGSLTELVNK